MLNPQSKISAYLQLMRIDRPIGIYLVLWPTLWALWLAAGGLPRWDVLIIFVFGVVLMRSAGCVINDFADRKLDGHVKRTQLRPLVTGRVSKHEALTLFSLLCIVAFLLVLLTNALTVALSFVALALATTYPFMKRVTHLPQIVLGAAFAWAVPMAFTAQTGVFDPRALLLFTAVVLWTVVYDTFYAMVDREDDIKVGIKSTAILFGDADRVITASLQIVFLILMLLVGKHFQLVWPYYVSLLAVSILFLYQQHLIKKRIRAQCFAAFLNNNWVGVCIFLGLVVNYQIT